MLEPPPLPLRRVRLGDPFHACEERADFESGDGLIAASLGGAR